MILLDPAIMRRGHIIFALTAGLRKWHSEQNTSSRTAEACMKYYVDQAAGAFWESLHCCFAVFSDSSQLRAMMFKQRLTKAEQTLVDERHPLVLEEDGWASVAGGLALALVDCRWRSMSWHAYGFPGSFAGLLHDDPGVVMGCLQHCKEAWLAFQEAKSRTEPLTQRLVTRSPLNTVVVEEVMLALAEVGFTVIPGDVRVRLEETFSCCGTKVCEDAFHYERRVEAVQQDSKTVNSTRKWWAPIANKVLGQTHSFEEVSWKSYSMEPSDASTMPPRSFLPTTKPNGTSMRLRGIVTSRDKTDWPTFSASSYPFLSGEQALMRHLYATNKWKDVDLHWLSCIMGPGMLVRPAGDGPWYFALGHMGGASLRH